MIPLNSTEITNEKHVRDEIILVSDKMLSYFVMTNTLTIGQCVIILGLIVNALNIIVFIQQGLQDPVNISLLGLSISDFGSLFFQLFANFCWTPSLHKLDLPFYPLQIIYFFVWIHVIFTRVTTGTTAWITFERCLCIVTPLKIKSIVTPRRTVAFIVMIYIIMVLSAVPVFYTTRAVWLLDPRRNKSVIGIAKISHSANIEKIAFWTNNLLPTVFFMLITICTVILVKELNKHVKWKEQLVTSNKQNSISSRDTKVVKMVTIISITFITCYAPGTVVFMFILIFPQMTFSGKQKNLLLAIFSILLEFETINATANFFIYIKMSSKFKSTFLNLFCVCYNKEKVR